MPASLRSDCCSPSGMPFGFPPESMFTFTGIPTRVEGDAIARVVAYELRSSHREISMPETAPFSPELFAFLLRLKRNNNRE